MLSHLERLEEMFGGWIQSPIVRHRMPGEICEAEVGLIFSVEQYLSWYQRWSVSRG